MTARPLRELLPAAFRQALADLDPARLVCEALPEVAPGRGRVRVIAAGKAALGMTRGALERWPERIDDALVITVDPLPAELCHPRIAARAAAHPVPDGRSVAAAEEALARAASLGPDDLLIALISGGASALLAAPRQGMPIAEKQALVTALLDRGAPIQAVNLVRRHLSRIKGGRLALAATPARVLTLILSDVIGGAPHDVGSGPTVPDPTTVSEAAAILRRFAPELRAEALLEESVKPETEVLPGVPFGRRIDARILADPTALARALGSQLARAGLEVSIEGPEEVDADLIVERRIARAASLRRGEAVVIACEPLLRLPSCRGRGGRAGFIALAAMRRLSPGVAMLCGASDGVDGTSGAGGAVVEGDAALWQGVGDAAIDDALERFDDAAIHQRLGSHIEGGASGHNLTDVHVLARA
jgi:hydroxypyruvate reductase